MFSRIFLEENIVDHPRAKAILNRFPNIPTKTISKLEDVFGRVKKPYLQKRDNLQLFLGEKKGHLVKQAPEAYGMTGNPHFYFIHSYNCIYECEYCYLQGYFDSPDMVFFLNHEEIGEEIIRLTKESSKEETPWFHAGEFSDSLALSHITGEIPYYYDLFKELPKARLELRTKSANIKELLTLEPLSNVYISFSLSPKERVKKTDLKTPPLSTRLKAMKELAQKGHLLGVHMDPIIFEEDFDNTYRELITELKETVGFSAIEYLSLGVVRFTNDVYHQVKKNYPKSDLHAEEFVKSFDGKVRYNRPMRLWMMSKIKELLMEAGLEEEKIYLCME